MTIEILIAIAGAVTGLAGILISWRTARASARKDELEVLRGIIAELRQRVDELEAENAGLKKRVTELEDENLRLRTWINRLEAENAVLRCGDGDA